MYGSIPTNLFVSVVEIILGIIAAVFIFLGVFMKRRYRILGIGIITIGSFMVAIMIGILLAAITGWIN